MALRIKIETVRGRYFLLLRDKGRIRARRRWNQKFTLRKGASLWRKNKTLDINISKRKLVTRPEFTEVTDFNKRPKIRENIPFRVIITGILKDGTVISASSQSRLWGSFDEAKEAALINFYERVAQHFNQEYEADEGLKFQDEIRSIKMRSVAIV